jgi:thymidylate kinase
MTPDPRVLVAEKIAESWNETGITYAVAHGLEQYPKSLGRDLDVFVNKADLHRALKIAWEVLREGGWTVVSPKNDPWPKRSIFAFKDGWAFQIDLFYRGLVWGPVTILDANVCPDSADISVGPFKINIWASFAKRIVIKLLAGAIPSDLFLNKNEEGSALNQCNRLFGESLAIRLIEAVKQGNIREVSALIPLLPRAALTRTFLLRPIESLRNSISWPLREIRPYFRRIVPYVAVIDADEKLLDVLSALPFKRSFMVSPKVYQVNLSGKLNVQQGVKEALRYVGAMLKAGYLANRPLIVNFKLESDVGEKTPSWGSRFLSKILWSLFPPDLIILPEPSSRSFYEVTLKERKFLKSLVFKAISATENKEKLAKELEEIGEEAFIHRHGRVEDESQERGLWVAILGPDGSGKSTLIEQLQLDLLGAFRRTAVFHLMPGLFRRGQTSGPVTDPHGKPPRSLPASLLKLAYYWLDYTLGYWLRIRPALVRSTLVLFDRYYDDLLVDPKRYRYGAPMGIARWLRRLIPRPDLWLILDVPEDEILRRKQEVPLEEMRRQREGYRSLAAELQNAVYLNGSQPPEMVAAQAREAVLEFLHERYLARRQLWFPEKEENLG